MAVDQTSAGINPRGQTPLKANTVEPETKFPTPELRGYIQAIADLKVPDLSFSPELQSLILLCSWLEAPHWAVGLSALQGCA